MRRLIPVLMALALAAGACGDDSGGEGGGDAAGSDYETLTALNDDLAGAGIACELEYQGLKDAEREISQCVIDDEQAILNIWFNEDLQQAIIDQSGATVAYGGNWTVQVGTPETAQRVADALGGATGDAG